MGNIGHTLGIVGRGRAVDNLFRAIAEGAIPLEGVDRIVFYNHTEGREKEIKFEQKILGKKPLPNDTTTAEDILKSRKIKLTVDDNFTTFYRSSSVVLFTPSIDIYDKKFKDISDAILEDFCIVDNTYASYISESSEEQEKEDVKKAFNPFYYKIMCDLVAQGKSQEEFFKKAYEQGRFRNLVEKERAKTEGVNPKRTLNDEQNLERRIALEAIDTIFQMKREGKLPYGERVWEFLAPSLYILIKYGKEFQRAITTNTSKPILVLTNEPSMACNILALFNPDLVPFLVGLTDYDTDRLRERFAKQFGLTKDEINFGVIGDHDSYIIPVFGRELLDKLGIKYQKACELFRKVVYTYVEDEWKQGQDPNVGVRTSILNVINSSLRSLETGLRFEGDFYNGVFVPLNRTLNTHGYSYSREMEELVMQGRLKLEENTGIFATYHHSFCNGRAVLLECEVSEYAQRQFVKCLADYTTLLCKLITNDVIGEQLFIPITESGAREKIRNLPYCEIKQVENKQ